MRFFARRLTDRHCKNIIDRQPCFLYNLLVMNKPPTTSHEYIYTQIRQRIRLGVYQSGSKLSENKLAKEFNCSRVPVRETFLRLQQEGLVTIQPQSGTYVRTYTLEDYRNALEVRAYLESLAAALVIEKNCLENTTIHFTARSSACQKTTCSLKPTTGCTFRQFSKSFSAR